MPTAVKAYPNGQDMGELFEIFQAPEKLGTLPSDQNPRSLESFKPRKEVHNDGDWHRAVHIWLINSKKELLLQRRSEFKDTFPNMWDVSVGGHVSAGDSTYETVIKELKEELHVDVDDANLKFLFRIATSNSGSTEKHGSFKCNEYKDIYLLKHDEDEKNIKFAEGEVAEVKWIPWKDVEANLRSRHEAYIPRPEDYINGLFDEIRNLTF